MLNTDFLLLLKTIFFFTWSFILLNDDASVKRVKKCGKFSSSYLLLVFVTMTNWALKGSHNHTAKTLLMVFIGSVTLELIASLWHLLLPNRGRCIGCIKVKRTKKNDRNGKVL